MNNFKKTGILLAILVVPVFLFLLIKFFFYAPPEVDLPYYVPADIIETKNGDTYEYDTVWHVLPKFEFTDQNGDSFGSKDLEGKVHVANFIFTRCMKECPEMTSQLLRVHEVYSRFEEVHFVSYTVDPENDTPEILKSYAEGYGANTESWSFLTGNKEALYEHGLKGYFLMAGEEEGPVNFIHSDKMVLVDKEGHIRGFYSGTDEEEVDRLRLELNVLLNSYDD